MDSIEVAHSQWVPVPDVFIGVDDVKHPDGLCVGMGRSLLLGFSTHLRNAETRSQWLTTGIVGCHRNNIKRGEMRILESKYIEYAFPRGMSLAAQMTENSRLPTVRE